MMRHPFSFRQMTILALAVLFLTITAAADAGGSTVAAIGSGPIVRNDPTSAREEAIRQASLTAVETAVSQILPREAIARQFAALNERIFTRAGSFVLNYKVLAQWQSGDQYRLLLACTVSEERLKEEIDRIGVPLSGAVLPQVLIMMAERSLSNDPPQFWWGKDYLFARAASERALATSLSEGGFNVVEPDPGSLGPSVEGGPMGPDPTLDEIRRMGQRFTAEVVICGWASASVSPNTMSGQPPAFTGQVRARAVRVDSGETIAEVEQTAVATAAEEISGGQNAIAAAAKLAGQELTHRLTDAWKISGNAVRTITLEVRGAQPLANFVRFRRMLAGLPDVQNVQTREMGGSQATLQIRLKGDSGRLNEAMLQHTFDAFRINIYESGPDHIGVELLPL